MGLSFGPDVTKRFLDDNDLKMVIRSHEVRFTTLLAISYWLIMASVVMAMLLDSPRANSLLLLFH